MLKLILSRHGMIRGRRTKKDEKYGPTLKLYRETYDAFTFNFITYNDLITR